MKNFLIDMTQAARGIRRDLFRFRGIETRATFWAKSILNMLILAVVLGPLLVANYVTADQLATPIMGHVPVVVAAALFVLTVVIGLNVPLMVRRLRDVSLPRGAYMLVGAATLACWLVPQLNNLSGMPMNILFMFGCFAPTASGLRYARKA